MRLLTIMTICLGISFACLAQDSYEIKLNRPTTVGYKYKFSGAGKEVLDNTVVIEGKEQPKVHSETSVEIEAESTILDVSPRGDSTRESLVIKKFSVTNNGGKSEPFVAGTVVIAYAKDGKTCFEQDGKLIDGETAEALGMVFEVYAGGPCEDDIFGAKEKKKIGESWDINGALFADDMKLSGIEVDKAKIEGRTTLDKLEKYKRYDCLRVSTQVKMKDAKPPLPPGFSIDKASMSISMTGLYPLDLKMGFVESCSAVKTQLSASNKSTEKPSSIKLESTHEVKTFFVE